MIRVFKLFFILLGFVSVRSLAQIPDWNWARSLGGSSSDYCYSVAVSSSGNGSVCTTGYFRGIVDFDPGPGRLNLGSSIGQSIFISKLDYSGDLVWAKAIVGTGYNTGASIAIEQTSAENIYITGIFEGTKDFDPGQNVFNLSAIDNSDIFIAKFDSLGNFIWAKTIGGIGYESGNTIKFDSNGNGSLLVSGDFTGTVDFDPGQAFAYRTSKGADDFFVTKLDTAGNLIWIDTFGSGDYDYSRELAIDQINDRSIYVTGWFSDTIDFDPGPNVYNLISHGGYDIFILKLDSVGNLVWAKNIGAALYDRGMSIVVEQNENACIYVTGYFYEDVDFDPGPGVSTLTAWNGDVFVSKYNGAGNLIWVKSFGGSFDDYSFSISIDQASNNSVYITGSFQNSADFDPNVGIFNLLSAGNTDTYVSKIDSAGYLIWAKSIGGSEPENGLAIASDKSGNMFLANSFFSSTINLDAISIYNTANGVPQISVSRLNDLSTRIEESKYMEGVFVFPNPSAEIVNVICENSSEAVLQISLTDELGREIARVGGSEKRIDVRRFSSGLYFLNVITSRGRYFKKLLIEK